MHQNPPRRFHYAWIILCQATLVVFASLGLARFGYTTLLPPMQEGLGLENTRAGALATANLIGYLILSVLGGALSARFGPRRVITGGLAVAGVSMLLTGLSRGFYDAAFWRMLTGMGSGASNVPAMGLVGAWFGARRRGLAAGVAVAGSSIALIGIGFFVPPLLEFLGGDGWRVCWAIFGVVALALALITWVIVRDRPAELGLAPLGDGPTASARPSKSGEALRWGLVYRSKAVWELGAVYAAYGFSYIIYITFFVKRLMADGGYSEVAAGRLFMVVGWFSLLCGVLWGAASDRFGRRAAVIALFLVHVLAYLLFGLSTQPAAFLVSAVLFGLSAWSIPVVMAATCADVLGSRLAPAALGFITFFFGIAQAASPSIAGALADATGSLSAPLLLAAGASVVGAAMAALLKQGRGATSPD